MQTEAITFQAREIGRPAPGAAARAAWPRESITVAFPWAGVRLRMPVWVLAPLGALAAAGVGYLTSANPLAAPAHLAVVLRVAIIGSLLAAGISAQVGRVRAPMGALLAGAGFYSVVWLLNGSAVRLLFSVGVLATALAPILFSYLMLAYPLGRLRTKHETRFLVLVAAATVLPWTFVYLTSLQPPIRTPLLACLPHCQPNAFFLGSAPPDLTSVLDAVVAIAWGAGACGTAALLVRRLQTTGPAARRSTLPVLTVAVGYAVCVAGYFFARATNARVSTVFGTASVAMSLAVPVAIFAGFMIERLFMGQALARFINELVKTPAGDPETLMATALEDPSLAIAYSRPTHGTYIDARGREVALPTDRERAVAWIPNEGAPVAAVVFDPRLAYQENFVHAAGEVAMLRLARAQLEADLTASTRELGASRRRLLEAADAERQRIERDLHDGIQQHLVGLRLKLDLAAEAVKTEPERGEQMLSSLGRQMEDVLGELRLLARGVYPQILTERGVGEALKSMALVAPIPVTVRASAIGRHPHEAEVAVYFCCLEALQNVAKHAGPDARATVTLSQEDDRLRFEVRDCGRGFDTERVGRAHGLTNMRDRIEAVGGLVTVTSRPGGGTIVRGWVPRGDRGRATCDLVGGRAA